MIFGRNDEHNWPQWICPANQFVYQMQAVMGDEFNALQFLCSDLTTVSQCYGKACASFATFPDNDGVKVISKKNLARMNMTAPRGFHSLDVQYGARVTALKSPDAYLAQNLLPD